MKIIVFLPVFVVLVIGLIASLKRTSIYIGNNLILLGMGMALIILAIIANVLAAAGVFSFRNVIICMGITAIVLNAVNVQYIFAWKNRISEKSFGQWIKEEIPATGVFVIALCMFSIFRIDPIMSADAQIYYYKALSISKTGTVEWFHDAYMSENYDELKDVVYLTQDAYSAYEYGITDDPGEYVVTELHLYSSLLAVGYKMLGNTGISLMCALAAAFAVFVLYRNFANFFHSEKWAMAAAVLMLICPAELYCARTCLSEVLTQLIVWTGVLFLSENLARQNLPGVILGCSLIAISTFNRIDAYIYIASLYILFIYWVIVKKNIVQMKELMWGIATASAISTLGFFYAYVFSYPYTYVHLRSGHLAAIILLCIILFLLGLALCTQKRRKKNTSKDIEMVLYKWLQQEKGAEILAGMVGIIIFFLYFLRPELSTGSTDAELWISMTMKQFCYYTSVVSMPLLVYGIYHLLKNIGENNIDNKMIYLVMGGINFFIYTIFPSVAARNYWASRRWMPVVIPFVFMMALYGMFQLFREKKLNKGIIRAIYIFIVCYLLFEGKALNMGKVNTYAYGHIGNLANNLSDDVVWFCDNKRLVCALRGYFEKRNVYILNIENEDEIEKYIKEHGEVYYVGGDPYNFLSEDVEAEVITECPILVESVEDSYDIPREIRQSIIPANLYVLRK